MQEIFPGTVARLEEWKANPDVLGVLLVGSKSHEHGDELSDDDLEILLTDEAYARFAPAEVGEFLFEGEVPDKRLIYDAEYLSLSAVEQRVDSHHDLDRWPYQRTRILFDRDGRTTAAVKAVGEMSAEFRRLRLIHATLDAGIAGRRSQKTLKRGMEGSGRLVLARGAKALSRILFALEWRWVPLDHWLEAELKTLEDPAQVGPLLIQAVVETRPELLIEGLKRLEDRLFEEGVPRPAGRVDLFYEVIHPTRAEERAIHGLY